MNQEIQNMIHETHLSLEKEDINNFQPTGRNRPCTEKAEADIRKNGYNHYPNNASKTRVDRDHEEETKEADTADLHVKITTERQRKTLPKNTDLKDEDKHDKGKEQRDTSIAMSITQNHATLMRGENAPKHKIKISSLEPFRR